MRFSSQALVPLYDDHQLLWDRMRLVSMQNSAPSLELRYERYTTPEKWVELYDEILSFLRLRHEEASA